MSFWISVHMKSEPSEDDTRENLLASWDIASPALLEKLVTEGKVKQTSFDYYPSKFSGSADDLLGPLFQELMQVHERKIHVKHQDRIDSCPPDAVLSVEIWDNS